MLSFWLFDFYVVESRTKSSIDDDMFEHLVGQAMAYIDEGIDEQANG